MANYKVTVSGASKELSAKEKIMLKDTSNAIKLDDACEGSPLTFSPYMYVILSVHNEKSDDKDYTQYLIVDKEGNKYVTGSKSFWASFIDIWEEMQDITNEDGTVEEYIIEVYKRDSKNYKGKKFISCSLVG